MLTSRDSTASSASPPPPSPAIAGVNSYNPSLLIIAAILAFVIAASASIHLLLRLLSRPSPPSIHHTHPSSSSSSTSSTPSDHDPTALISCLPLSTAAAARISGDCAVCLSRLRPSDRLRLLPACLHAFHPSCIDAWIRSSPSCPLCRSPITAPRPEIRTPRDPPLSRSLSIGSEEEEDIEAVVARVTRGLEEAAKEEEMPAGEGDGGMGGWLKEYVDRLASSASSSFSSIRRGSRRFDGGGAAGEREGWDLEDGSGYWASFNRWLSGVPS